MDIGERITTAAMMGAIDTETFDKLMDIHLRVVRQITCPITGRVLDSRTSHLLTIDHEEKRSLSVVHESAGDDVISERLDTIGARVVERFNPADAWETING